MTEWHRIHGELYNPYLSREQNIQNGVDIPDTDRPVLLYDIDEPRYYCGRISEDVENKCLYISEALHGDIIDTGTNSLWYFIWADFDEPDPELIDEIFNDQY